MLTIIILWCGVKNRKFCYDASAKYVEESARLLCFGESVFANDLKERMKFALHGDAENAAAFRHKLKRDLNQRKN